MHDSESSVTAAIRAPRGARLAAALRRTGAFGGALITLVLLVLFVVAPLLHIGFSPVLTGSMRPAYAPGDLLVTAPADVSSLRPGQIAVFIPPGENIPYAHRITAVTGSPTQPVLITKGDANPAPDSWRATLAQSQVPVVIATVPAVGTALLWIQNPVPRALFTAVIGLSLTGCAVRWILQVPPRRGATPTTEPAA